MNFQKVIFKAMIDANYSIKGLAQELNESYHTVYQKLHRPDFKLKWFMRVMDILGKDIQIIEKVKTHDR